LVKLLPSRSLRCLLDRDVAIVVCHFRMETGLEESGKGAFARPQDRRPTAAGARLRLMVVVDCFSAAKSAMTAIPKKNRRIADARAPRTLRFRVYLVRC
jgi:hypothetical protein